LYSPFFLASKARPLSSMRTRIRNPPNRPHILRGGRRVKSVGVIGELDSIVLNARVADVYAYY
jgi:hypothetical protein